MKRRTFQRLKAAKESAFHHSIYVVLLSPEAAKHRKVLALNPHRNPALPCVYVGMTGLKPEERFANHKAGIKASWLVRRYGVGLLPKLYECFNPMPFEAACQMERDFTEDLRAAGYTVTGGV